MSILIKNGTIFDGSGKPGFLADVYIEKDKIKEIGSLKKLQAETIIDAKDLYIAPGFIDILNHSDAYLTIFSNPSLESLLYQGITTIVCGNCGSSLAPLVKGELISSVQKWGDIEKVNVNWLKLSEFLSEIKKLGLAVNFATLVGHSTIRRGIVGDEYRSLTRQELDKMKMLLEEAITEGAFGFSLGLAYSHAKIAPKEELAEIIKLATDYKTLFSCHLREESKDLLISVNEVLNLARETGANLEISHFKIMGKNFWPKFDSALAMLDSAAKSGLNINFDFYPYTATAHVLHTLLPDWVMEGGKEKMLARLRDKKSRSKIIRDLKKSLYEYKNLIISEGSLDRTFFGKSLEEIAKNQGVSVEEALLNLIITAKGRVIVFSSSLAEENLVLALKSPLSLIGSDSAGYRQEDQKTRGIIHPRSFGAFPRVLSKFVRKDRLLNWEKAIYKMSGGPAKKVGIKMRGSLQKNYFGDLVIFNPKTIQDKATFENPYQYPEGVEYVIVNGDFAIKNGKFTGKRLGQVLRSH